jgi:hypothetical protein
MNDETDKKAAAKIRYHVVYSEKIGALIDVVNGRLADGWELQGGIFKSSDQFYQAIKKHVESR